MKRFIFLLLSAILFFSCIKTGNITELKLSDTSLTFSSESGSRKVNVLDRGVFRIVVQEDGEELVASETAGGSPFECHGEWLSVECDLYDNVLTVSVADNTSGKSRHAKIYVYGANCENEMDVFQVADSK
ncbi:MAG: hypothetical protein NC308_02440 [Clostridium sp.]|nr:hypothetical protein [Bacteroides sp.]MCM1197722.1 hypothetical protein [Clostridium sp.]